VRVLLSFQTMTRRAPIVFLMLAFLSACGSHPLSVGVASFHQPSSGDNVISATPTPAPTQAHNPNPPMPTSETILPIIPPSPGAAPFSPVAAFSTSPPAFPVQQNGAAASVNAFTPAYAPIPFQMTLTDANYPLLLVTAPSLSPNPVGSSCTTSGASVTCTLLPVSGTYTLTATVVASNGTNSSPLASGTVTITGIVSIPLFPPMHAVSWIYSANNVYHSPDFHYALSALRPTSYPAGQAFSGYLFDAANSVCDVPIYTWRYNDALHSLTTSLSFAQSHGNQEITLLGYACATPPTVAPAGSNVSAVNFLVGDTGLGSNVGIFLVAPFPLPQGLGVDWSKTSDATPTVDRRGYAYEPQK